MLFQISKKNSFKPYIQIIKLVFNYRDFFKLMNLQKMILTNNTIKLGVLIKHNVLEDKLMIINKYITYL